MGAPQQQVVIDEKKWQEWIRWVDRIQADIQELRKDQQRFALLKGVVSDNARWLDDHDPGRFVWFVRRWYVTHASMGVRRQVKCKKDKSISLVRLLDEIRRRSGSLTFKFYLDQHPRGMEGPPWQALAFGKLARCGRTIAEEDVISADIVEEDIRALTDKGSRLDDVVALVDKEFAHLDSVPSENPVYLSHIDDVLDLLDQITSKYLLFLKGEQWGPLKLPSSAEDIFKIPWSKPMS